MQKAKKSLGIFISLLLLYFLLRVIFYELYFTHSGMSAAHLLNIFYWGLRMDISAVFYSNFIFFLYFFLVQDRLPVRLQKPLAVFFLAIINLPLLAVNTIDLAYYRFNQRRSTVDLFNVISGSLPAFAAFWKSWWWLWLLFGVISAAVIYTFRYWLRNVPEKRSIINNLGAAACFLLPAAFLARGLSERPIIPSTPLLQVPAVYQSLAGNSTMTILYSMVKKQTTLQEKHYFTNPDSLFTARRQYKSEMPFNKMNVVIFVLESFSKEYTIKTDPLHAEMPFLDSIMAASIVCENAYANGLESNKGLTAILAGIPPFFDEPFYYSNYTNNKIRGAGTLLEEQGYHTSFFMGAGYDHFGFARLASILGISKYYSMDDYGNKKHYDGNWGIFDHYFLPYAAMQLNKAPRPFFSTIFTISTHFPNTLPDTLKQRFTITGQGPEQNSVSYLDYALRLFFDVVKNQPWYHNTLFVFTADHNLYWHGRSNASLYKTFRIPVFFYLPGRQQHVKIDKPVQQLDIIPTVLDMLHYQLPFMSFGRSVFDTITPGLAIGHYNDIYQVIDSSFVFGYNDNTEQPVYLYNFRKDTALNNNLLTGSALKYPQAAILEHELKAQIEYFNYSMINNKLYVR